MLGQMPSKPPTEHVLIGRSVEDASGLDAQERRCTDAKHCHDDRPTKNPFAISFLSKARSNRQKARSEAGSTDEHRP